MFPSYLLHESAVWSNIRRQWLFFPRRLSYEPYDDVSIPLLQQLVVPGCLDSMAARFRSAMKRRAPTS